MEGETTQWAKDTKGAIISRKWKKDRQHNGQKIPKGQSEVVNGRTDNTMAKTKGIKRTNNDLQNTT